MVRISDGVPAVTEADGLTRADLNAVTAVGQEVWAVGDAGIVLHRSGGTWSRQQLGTARLAAFLAAEDQLRAADLHGVAHAATPPSSRATASELEGNQAWK